MRALLIVLTIFFITGCQKDFTEISDNPNVPEFAGPPEHANIPEGAAPCNGNNNPGAREICNNGVDDDCDGDIDGCDSDCGPTEVVDIDNDGYNFCLDCDDNNGRVNPGVIEICDNGIDDDCDGDIDGCDSDCPQRCYH